MRASLQAGHSSSEPQQGNSVAGSPVPAVPALPAAHAVPVEATPAVQSPPADAGDAAGGLVQTAREERRKVRDPLCASSTPQFHNCPAACIRVSQVLVRLLDR